LVFDLICAGVAFLFLVLGIFRGLIRQIFGLAGFIGGLVLARLFSAQAAMEFGPALGLGPAIATIAFSIAIFIAVDVAFHLVGNFLHSHLGAITGTIDKLGGGAVGLAKGLLIVWALASLAALYLWAMPAAQRNIGFAKTLDLTHSQVVTISQSENFLGDIENELKAARARK
jgi:membrane protein required for colicin V production